MRLLYILERIRAACPSWIPASVLFRELKSRGYPGGLSTVRAYVSKQKPRKKKEPVKRFETLPGEQLQVDFTIIHRGRYPLKAFVATLGYSRASFAWFTETEKQFNWLEGLEAAFKYFGGTPKEILFDNAKCIMIQRDAYGPGQHQWNKQLLTVSKHYGFICKACRPYRAKTKSKVERFNRYLKESFVVPLAASLKQAGLILTPDLANAHIGPWLLEVANQREHGTTGVRPAIRLDEEHEHFAPLPHENLVHQALFKYVGKPDAERIIPVESLQHPLSLYDQFVAPSVIGVGA